VIDVFTADRVGLLHTLSRTAYELGLSVDLARITTEGHRAADAFYVRNREGHRVEGAEAKRVVEAVTQALTRN
jgi:[protein-PII] uridylyltransferase